MARRPQALELMLVSLGLLDPATASDAHGLPEAFPAVEKEFKVRGAGGREGGSWWGGSERGSAPVGTALLCVRVRACVHLLHACACVCMCALGAAKSTSTSRA